MSNLAIGLFIYDVLATVIFILLVITCRRLKKEYNENTTAE